MLLPVNAAMMDACVLAALEKGDTYGYRITQELAHGIGASESSLYPVLRRLLKDGCLTTHDQAVDGRIRRYYHITPPGRMRLDEALRDWAAYRDSIEKVFFGG